ncbi:MAG: hypothetical protein M0P01_02940 [Treponema sp.]|nr:hypothetical protein [Treponema sp.]
MDLFINGTKTDITLENEKTIGDVLRSFELTCEQNDAAVIGIKVDDKKVDADSFDSYINKTLTEKTKFEFDVITKQVVRETFKKLSEIFNTLSVRMEQVPADIQSGNGKSACKSITQLADNIDLFCHTAALSSLFPETYKSILIDNKPFTDFFAGFTPVLSQLENALKANDTVLVGDLSEYEICPRLKAVSKALEVFNDI